MKTILFALTTLLIFGCVSTPQKEFNDWALRTKPLAESGQMKWSDYYKEAWSRLASAPASRGKAEAMERANNMITIALSYEDGTINKESFELARRTMETQAHKQAEAASAANSAALGQSIKNYGNAVYGPDATRRAMVQPEPAQQYPGYVPKQKFSCQTIGNQTLCNEQ